MRDQVDSITLRCVDAEHTGRFVRDTQFREVAVAIFKPDRANGFSTDGGDQGVHNQGVAPESLSLLMRC